MLVEEDRGLCAFFESQAVVFFAAAALRHGDLSLSALSETESIPWPRSFLLARTETDDIMP